MQPVPATVIKEEGEGVFLLAIVDKYSIKISDVSIKL